MFRTYICRQCMIHMCVRLVRPACIYEYLYVCMKTYICIHASYDASHANRYGQTIETHVISRLTYVKNVGVALFAVISSTPDEGIVI